MIKIPSKLQFITQTGIKDVTIEKQISEFLEGGGKWIQLRMKGANIEDIEMEAILSINQIKDRNAFLTINDYPEICHIAGDGVHLGKNDTSISDARNLLGSEYIIGGTANNLQEFNSLNNSDVDYIGLGPLNFTSNKKNLAPVLGFEGIKQILKEKKDKPVIIVGGIVMEDILKLLDIGADGIAVSSLIAKSKEIKKITNQLLELLYK